MVGFRFDLLGNFQPYFLVSFGAGIGAYIRFLLVERLRLFSFKNQTILSINLFSSFAVGFFSSLISSPNYRDYNHSSELMLLVCVGFLGGLSTFSSFIVDVLKLIGQRNFLGSVYLLIFSVLGGLIAAALGIVVGNV